MEVEFQGIVGTVKLLDYGKSLDVCKENSAWYHRNIISWRQIIKREIDLLDDRLDNYWEQFSTTLREVSKEASGATNRKMEEFGFTGDVKTPVTLKREDALRRVLQNGVLIRLSSESFSY